jgi:uncharacterized membrane protein
VFAGLSRAPVAPAANSVPALSTADIGQVQHRRLVRFAVIGLLVSLLVAFLVLQLDLLATVVFMIVLTLMGVAWQPRLGLYVLFGLSLLFESVSPDPLMRPGYFLPLQLFGALINPEEILLLLVTLVWLGQGIARRRLDFRRGQSFGIMMLFLVSLLSGLIHGIPGGDFHIGLWESRFLFYMVICYVLAANILRSYRHLSVIVGLIIVCNGLFAIEGAYRHLVLDIKGDAAFEHVDVIFMGSAFVLAFATNVFGAPRWQRLTSVLTLPIVGYTLLASERRAGYIAIVIALVACTIVLYMANRKASRL